MANNQKLEGTTTVRIKKVSYQRAKVLAAQEWITAEQAIDALIVIGLKKIDEVKNLIKQRKGQ